MRRLLGTIHPLVADRCVAVCLLATVRHDLIQDGTAEGTLREVNQALKPEGRLAVVCCRGYGGRSGASPSTRERDQEEYYWLKRFKEEERTRGLSQI